VKWGQQAMTSTASFKEKFKQAFSFFRWELKSCAGTLTVYAILTGVFMTIVLTLCLVLGLTGVNTDILADTCEYVSKDEIFAQAVQSFQNISTGIIFLMTIIFTVIYTIKVFSYLHNKRQADLYGSMPVSRATLYLAKSASAFIFSIVPAMVFMGIVAVVSFILGYALPAEIVMNCVKMLMGTLACIAAYGLVAVCCGTTINSVVMFLALCIAYPIAALFVKGVAGGFFVGFYTGGLNESFVMNALNPLDAYAGTNIIYWLVFTAVCVVAGVFLIKKRKAERAQASFAYYLPCHIVKLLISFIAGMFLGVLFGSLNVLGNGMLGFVFGFVLAGVPAFIVCHLIFYKGFSQLIKTSIPLGGLVVVVIGAMFLCNADIFGYNSYIPEAENVASAGFLDFSECYIEDEQDIYSIAKSSSADFTSDEDIKTIVELQGKMLDRLEFTSRNKFCNVWSSIINDIIGEDVYTFDYTLKDGRTVTRVYSETFMDSVFDGIYDDIYDDYYDSYYNSYYEFKHQTNKIKATKTYQEKYGVMMNVKAEYLSNMDIYGYDEDEEAVYNETIKTYDYNTLNDNKKEVVNNIIEAYRKDFEADESSIDTALYTVASGYIGGSDWNMVGITCPDAVCEIDIQYSKYLLEETSNLSFSSMLLSGSAVYYSDYGQETIVVPKSYTNTIAALKDAGILNDDMTVNGESYDYTVVYE
jgi:ABC-2 type transport system permease protein